MLVQGILPAGAPWVQLTLGSQFTVGTMAVLLGLVEAQSLDDAVRDDDLVHVHKLKLLASNPQFPHCFSEGRGQGGVVEIIWQPHGHDEQQLPAE